VARSLSDGVACWEEDPQHLEQDQDGFIVVGRTALKNLTVEVVLCSLALILIETDKLVGLQILEVAHCEQLRLTLQLGRSGWLLRGRNDCQEAVLSNLLLSELIDFELEPSEREVKTDFALVPPVQLVFYVFVAQIPVRSTVSLSHILLDSQFLQKLGELLVHGNCRAAAPLQQVRKTQTEEMAERAR